MAGWPQAAQYAETHSPTSMQVPLSSSWPPFQNPVHRPDTTATTRQLGPNIITATVDGGRIVENIFCSRGCCVRRSPGWPAEGGSGDPSRARRRARMPKNRCTGRCTRCSSNKRSERDIFNQAFVMFWRDPEYLKQMLSLMVPNLKAGGAEDDKELSRRMTESLFKAKASRHSAGRGADRG